MNGESIYRQYKPSLIFILKFTGIYLIFSILYNIYLSLQAGQTDFLSLFVGKILNTIYHSFGINAELIPLQNEAGLKLIINGQYLARIVEGCTAMSVIIMFISFILSFGNASFKAIKFAAVGSVLIFVFNILRILFLSYILYYFPKYQDVAHRVLFPALIYGFVVFLWYIFIKKSFKNG